MARLPRLSVAGLPHHVVWCGHAGQSVFRDDADRLDFLRTLAAAAPQHRVQWHAYLLAPTQVHLLCTPESSAGLSSMMQALGRGYGRRFNLRHGRQGALWEGRYRSTVLEPGDWVLDTMVLLDTEPVHHAWADAPERYLWSSHAHYLGVRKDNGLVAPAVYWALGNTPFAREVAYARRVALGLRPEQRRHLIEAAIKGWALGREPFLAALQAQTDRRLVRGRPGRPRKQPL
jgi:putative transposase